MRKKNINLWEARELSEKFCNDFGIDYCEVYYVDRLKDALGVYIWLDPPHMLVVKNYKDKIAIVMHELIHHLDSQVYDTMILNHSTQGYLNAKKRVITWCKNNISSKADWNKGLKAQQFDHEMKKFQL
jgi:hypothetical protein